MTTTTETYSRTQRKAIEALDGAYKQHAALIALHAYAIQLNNTSGGYLAYEVDTLGRTVDEFEGEIEYRMDEAAMLGLGPDDL